MKKFHLCIVALALVFLFVAQGPSQAIASSLPRYVSELKISTSEDSAEDAKQWLSNNGYKVLDSDLNDGTGEGYVYLGYKTTTDKSKAVTNISLMEMNGGFKRLNCRASLQAAAGNIDGYVDELMTMAQEFRANLEAGTLTAKLAKRGLDLFYVPEAGNKCLSDYLTASTTKTADFYNLLLMTNSTVLSSIYSYLAVGVENSDGSSWLQKLSDLGPIDPSPLSSLSRQGSSSFQLFSGNDTYETECMIAAAISDFSTKYNEALARTNANNGVVATPSITSDDQTGALVDQLKSESLDSADTSNTDLIYIAAYKNLQKYKFGRTTLAELFTTPVTDMDTMYPLAELLTNGQKAAIHASGLLPLIVNSFHTTDSYNAAIKKMDTITDTFSVWAGVNTDAYDGEIGVTSNAYRSLAATNSYNALVNSEDKFGDTLSCIFEWVGVVSSCASLFFLVMSGISTVSIALPVFFSQCFVTSILAGIAQGIAASPAGSICGIISIVLTVIIGIIYLVKYLVKLYNYYHPDYTTIPTTMYDIQNDQDFIKYDVATDQDGKAADLNRWEGQQWNALYYTTDARAGSPITVDDLGNAFMVKKGDGTTPDGYRAISMFGEQYAVDMNRNVYNNDISIYIFFLSTEAPVKTTEGKYLSAVYIQTEDTPEAAIYQLKNLNYKVLNVNLTEGLDKATYLGYRTNDSVSLALTDVRIEYGTKASSYKYGDASYGYCGSSGPRIDETQETMSGGEYSLYATNDQSAGDPILATETGLYVTNNMLSKSSGYEPASLFCSGAPFDFNTQQDEPQKSFDKHVYLYFNPSVKHTSGTEYMAGLYFATIAYVQYDTSHLDYITTLGGKETGYRSCPYTVQSHIGVICYDTRLCYTTTYNPKRAIYDVGYFSAGESADDITFPDNVSFIGEGYSVCENMVQCSAATLLEGMEFRTVRASNSFKINNKSEFGYDSVGMALYVTGATSSFQPLKADEFRVASDASYYTVFGNAIRNVTQYFDHKSFDFSQGTKSYEDLKLGSMYMFIRTDGKQMPKYIQDIKMNYTDLDDYSAEYSKLTLMSEGCDQIIDRDLNAEDDEDHSGYIGLIHTNNASLAKIRGIALYYVGEGESVPPSTIKESDGVVYNLLDTKGIYTDDDNTVYIYTSTSRLLGDPITSVVIDKSPYVQDKETAPFLGNNGKAYWYLHFTRGTATQTYISLLDVIAYSKGYDFEEDNDIEYIFDSMLMKGYRSMQDYSSPARLYESWDYNRYIGYTKSANKNKAITGVIITRNQSWQNYIYRNGIAYYPIPSRTNLNVNPNDQTVCMYYTTDKNAGAPIIGLWSGGSGYYSLGNGWEVVTDTNYSPVNINTWKTGDWCGSDSYYSTTGGCYLYVQRASATTTSKTTSKLVSSVFSNPTAFSLILFSVVILLSGTIVMFVQKRKKKRAVPTDQNK